MSDDLAVSDTESSEIAQIRLSEEDWVQLNGLTVKQRAFVFEYPKDFNGTRAAERAGYAGREAALAVRGSMLLRHPKVNPLIRKLTAATADEMGITREYLLAKIDEVAELTLRGEPYMLEREDGTLVAVTDANGDQVYYNRSPQNTLKAMELLAKLRGDMIERSEVTTRSIEIRINDVDLEDLR